MMAINYSILMLFKLSVHVEAFQIIYFLSEMITLLGAPSGEPPGPVTRADGLTPSTSRGHGAPVPVSYSL